MEGAICLFLLHFEPWLSRVETHSLIRRQWSKFASRKGLGKWFLEIIKRQRNFRSKKPEMGVRVDSAEINDKRQKSEPNAADLAQLPARH